MLKITKGHFETTSLCKKINIDYIKLVVKQVRYGVKQPKIWGLTIYK